MAINRKGHLFVLIGPLTGSAAVINAAQFHTMTHALLVGEAIGAKPAEYRELKNMTLPYTGIIVGYSTRYYDFAHNAENIVAPDHEAKAYVGRCEAENRSGDRVVFAGSVTPRFRKRRRSFPSTP